MASIWEMNPQDTVRNHPGECQIGTSSLSHLSILIVTYKGDGLLHDCLVSLQKTCGGEPQIVVVDNSPSDDTKRLVAEFPRTVYVRATGNLGFAGGNNLGLPYCENDFVLLLNNDTLVHDRTSFTGLMDYLEKHPEVGAAQGKLVMPNHGNLLGGCGSYLTWYGILYSTGFLEKDAPQFNCAHSAFTVSGAFFLFRKSVLPSVGGNLFYDHFKSYFEEVNFCHRLWLAGYEVHYVPTAPIDHLVCQTSGKFRYTEITRQYYRNILFSYLTCLGFWGLLLILPPFLLLLVGHAFFYLFKGNTGIFKADFGAIGQVWKDWGDIKSARRIVQGMRKILDFQLFRRVMRQPSLHSLAGLIRFQFSH